MLKTLLALVAILLLCALAAPAETKTEALLLVSQYPMPGCENGSLGQICIATAGISPRAQLWIQAKDAGERDVQIEADVEVNGQPQVYIVKPTWDEGRAWATAIVRIRGTDKVADLRILKLTIRSILGDKTIDNPQYGVIY